MKRILVAAAIVAIFAGSMLPGWAHTKSFPTGVAVTGAALEGSTVVVSGTVDSAKGACLDRRVTIRLAGSGTTIGSGRSNDAGSFSIPATLDDPGARVQAKALKEVVRNNRTHSHVCRAATSDAVEVDGAAAVDLTALPVGDGRYSTSARRGYVFSCRTSFTGGGASTQGPWFNGDGTWDMTKKGTVDGSVEWPHDLDVSLSGTSRVFSGNNLPLHPTGTFPISSSDDAYQYDRNPNSISAQNVAFTLPADPALLDTPECAGGTVGYMLSGGYLFNGFDAAGRDAVAWEVQDGCDGHPQNTGVYHYHSVSGCAEGTSDGGHSDLLGYAFDGFGIFGHFGTDGEAVTNEDLDVCHGHTHPVEWDGETRSMYHYHATYEFPYSVGCFRGDAIR